MISVNDLASFFIVVVDAYDEFLLFGMSLMIAMSVLIGIKRLFVEGN